MFDRKKKAEPEANLLDRIVTSRCRRIAIVGLHPGAGARTVLAALVREVQARSWPFAVSALPRLALEADEEAGQSAVVPLDLPAGAFFATAEGAISGSASAVETVEATSWESPLGPIILGRTRESVEVGLRGPSEAEPMRDVIDRLAERSGGMVLVEGGWERRAFAAPGACDGIILVVGAGFSATPARAAAATRYVVETLSVPPCDEPARVAWHDVASKGAAAMLDARGRPAGLLPPGLEDPVPALKAPDGSAVATVVLPHGLNDEFMIPLVRSKLRCTLVVRDATRLNVAPIYYKAWLKGRGRFHVVHATRLVAVATNPFNPRGPDADPEAFRKTVATTLPDVPVHDVALEADDAGRRPLWKFWG